jgi:hypothetical protein
VGPVFPAVISHPKKCFKRRKKEGVVPRRPSCVSFGTDHSVCARKIVQIFLENVKLFFLSTFVVVKVEKKTGEGSRLRRHSSTNGQARTLL